MHNLCARMVWRTILIFIWLIWNFVEITKWQHEEVRSGMKIYSQQKSWWLNWKRSWLYVQRLSVCLAMNNRFYPCLNSIIIVPRRQEPTEGAWRCVCECMCVGGKENNEKTKKKQVTDVLKREKYEFISYV